MFAIRYEKASSTKDEHLLRVRYAFYVRSIIAYAFLCFFFKIGIPLGTLLASSISLWLPKVRQIRLSGEKSLVETISFSISSQPS